jgi:hypothetical protein
MPRDNFDPIQIIQSLPWRNLLMAGGLAVAIALVCDWLLGFALMLFIGLLGRAPALAQVVVSIISSPVNELLFSLLVSGMIGVLALFLLERFFPPKRYINPPMLWGLVCCIMLALLILWATNLILDVTGTPHLVRGLGLVGAHQLEVVMTVLGVFFYGKRYWR